MSNIDSSQLNVEDYITKHFGKGRICHVTDAIRDAWAMATAAKDAHIKELQDQCLDAERDYRKCFKESQQKDAEIVKLREELEQVKNK